jgi:hypothetical protein
VVEEAAGQTQRYCRNCGAEAAPGNAFCVSCGERLATGSEDPWQTGRSSASERSPAFSAGAGRGILRNLLRRVGELPVALKVAGAVVGAVLLLTLLSPLTAVGAVVLFAVSVVALSVRVVQQKSVVRWGMVAAASFVLALTTAGVSNAIYGTGGVEGTSANEDTQYADSAYGPSSGSSEYEQGDAYCDPSDPNCRSLCGIMRNNPEEYVRTTEHRRNVAMNMARTLESAASTYPYWSEQDLVLVETSIDLSNRSYDFAEQLADLDCVPPEYEDHYGHELEGLEEVSLAADEVANLVNTGDTSSASRAESHLASAFSAFREADRAFGTTY